MSELFSSLTLRELTFKNRIFVSPMCQYSSENGLPTDWHLVHLGSRAVGGAALVMVEATAVSPQGRISPGDSGIWSDAHGEAFKRITAFIKSAGSIPGIQLAHAGRKASTDLSWRGSKPLPVNDGGWPIIGPSPIPFDAGYQTPRPMTEQDMKKGVDDFVAGAKRAIDAGFEVVEIHAAHGYLLHEFLSPISNQRTDDFGGTLENRMRFPLRVAQAIRKIWPANRPVFVRISATDWVSGGWDLAQSVEFAKALKEISIDLIDCSSGGNVPRASIPSAPGYQVPFAESIRQNAQIPTAAVGLITDPQQAEQIIATKQADAVLLARGFLRDPYWALHAADMLGAQVDWPVQYVRAKRPK